MTVREPEAQIETPGASQRCRSACRPAMGLLVGPADSSSEMW